MDVPVAAQAHYKRMQALQVVTLVAADRAWKRVEPDRLKASWAAAADSFEPVLTGAQVRAASFGAEYGAATLVESSGVWVRPEAFVDPKAFGGFTSRGAPMPAALTSPVLTTLSRISEGHPVGQALASGRAVLDRLVRTQVADAGRVAAGVDAASRAGVGYVRMLNPPSCDRCALLAGRRYRWNQGFLRHPNCDCVHVVATSKALSGAESEGLLVDPYEYFGSLSEAEQDRVFGVANADAIRDGSDINRVVNAKRGTSTAGDTTSSLSREYGKGRLTPEGIYQQAGSRAEALELLERNGYVLPGGQVPGGSIRGWDYEGYGALGRGGTRVGVRDAVERARVAGVRDGSRATMTAAERRLNDAKARYEAVLDGTNPYGKGPLTPNLSARAETDFRRWLNTDGQMFTN